MKKSISKKRRMTLLVSLLLILGAGVGMTLAYVFTQSDSLVNEFTPSQVSCAVVETINAVQHETANGQVTVKQSKTDVKIHNTGNTEAYIRAKLVVTWKDAEGNVYGKLPVEDTDYSIDLNTEGSWILGADGFYYYTKPVAPDDHDDADMTDVLIESCAYMANAPEGYTLSVEVVASAIQSQPTNVVTTQWASGVSGVDGTTLQIKKGG